MSLLSAVEKVDRADPSVLVESSFPLGGEPVLAPNAHFFPSVLPPNFVK